MQSLKELYKIGRGPSSSHTLAPERACKLFTQQFGVFDHYIVELYGSLSLTGKGHCTDQIIQETLPSSTKVYFRLDWEEEFPNGFYIFAYDEKNELQQKWTVFSIGGGSIKIKEFPTNDTKEVYKENQFKDILEYINKQQLTLTQYIYQYEPDLKSYLKKILDAEIDCVKRGLNTTGVLPGKLKLTRSAKNLYEESLSISDGGQNSLRLMAYAYAASEENAAGHTCVTAPTLGASGVMAAMLYHYKIDLHYSDDDLIDALAVGGIFGNLIKQNATISGAVGGCQAEVGAAVSMASAAIAYLDSQDINQVEYAAEIGMEHHLGLTCDPVLGYVMIPCIERNAMGVLRAKDAAQLSKHMSRFKAHLVSFDMVVDTMNETGKKIPIELKETSIGGLAKEFETKGMVYEED